MLRWQINDHTDIFIHERIEFYSNNNINRRPLTPHYAMLYPQNGDRIVAIDPLTSFHPIYKLSSDRTTKPGSGRFVTLYAKSGVTDTERPN